MEEETNPISYSVESILDTAKKLITDDRRKEYGDVKESFEEVASLWSVYLGTEVEAKDVAMMMVMLKIQREKHKHKPDNLVDICGYAALASQLNTQP